MPALQGRKRTAKRTIARARLGLVIVPIANWGTGRNACATEMHMEPAGCRRYKGARLGRKGEDIEWGVTFTTAGVRI